MNIHKVFFVLCFCILFLDNIFGQVTIEPDKVGIGVDNPSRNLHIVATTNNEILRLEDANGTDASSRVYLSFFNSGERIGSLGDISSNISDIYLAASGDRNLRFSAGNSTRMLISQTGNVGVGTASPSEKLEVNGNIATNGALKTGYLCPTLIQQDAYRFLRFGQPSEYYAGFMWNNSSASYGDGDDFTIFTYENRDIAFRPHGTGNSYFHTGNVGIGISTPSEKLEVNGNILANGIKFPDGTMQVTAATGGSGGSDNLGNHTATQNIKLNGEWLSGDGGNEGVFVTSTGRVGIGTSSPVERLQTAGGIKVGNAIQSSSGTIRYNGDLQVYSGSEWLSLTTQPEDLPLGTWIPAVQQSGPSWYHSPCSASCDFSGYSAASDSDGYVCKEANGNRGGHVEVNGTSAYRCTGAGPANGGELAQCYCLINSNNNLIIDDTLERNMETIKVLKSQNEAMQSELLELQNIVYQLLNNVQKSSED